MNTAKTKKVNVDLDFIFINKKNCLKKGILSTLNERNPHWNLDYLLGGGRG
jgi:hypothetical protein